MSGAVRAAVHNGKLYSTQDIVYLLAVLAPTRRNEKTRKRLHKMLHSLEENKVSADQGANGT